MYTLQLAKLQTEYMKGATSLLFELILMAEQVTINLSHSTYTTSILV